MIYFPVLGNGKDIYSISIATGCPPKQLFLLIVESSLYISFSIFKVFRFKKFNKTIQIVLIHMMKNILYSDNSRIH